MAALNRAQRRFAASKKAGRKFTIVRDRDLTEAAFEKLEERLALYGNVLSEEHRKALMCVVTRFTHLANGHQTGRWGYALPCGAGKTEAAKAWCWALYTLRKPYSVAISASKVEALCELKRGLIELGVPEQAIGLEHTYTYDPSKLLENGQMQNGYASLPCTKNHDERQILLLTHNKLRGKSDERVAKYHGKARSLVIYDKSLLISDTWNLSMVALDQAKGVLEPVIKRTEASADLRDAHSYVSTCIDLLDVELKAQSERKPQVVDLPRLATADCERMILALQDKRYSPLRHLITWAQSPMRAVATNSGGGYVWYQLAVPHDLKNVAVLDASLVIRLLPKIGGQLQTDEAFNGNVKRNGNVTVHQMLWRSGRRAMEAEFRRERREDRNVSKEIIEVVRTIPENEGVLLWSFKEKLWMGQKSINILDRLRDDLHAAGINTDATFVTPSGAVKPRFEYLTYGNETSTNDYVDYSNTILCGVLHRDDLDLAASVLGQKDDLLADHEDLAEIKRSEVAHVVYQAISRGPSRKIINGEAGAQNVWLIHLDDRLGDLLKVAMPGLVLREWQPQFLQGAATRKTKTLAETILDHLEATKPAQVSTRALKGMLGLQRVPRMTFTDALTKLVTMTDKWRLDGRSLVAVGET